MVSLLGQLSLSNSGFTVKPLVFPHHNPPLPSVWSLYRSEKAGTESELSNIVPVSFGLSRLLYGILLE